MSIAELAALLGIIAGCLISGGVIWTKGVKPMWRLFRRIEAVHELVIDKLPVWMESVDVSLKELHPNGGHSLKDTVNQTQDLLIEHINNDQIHTKP